MASKAVLLLLAVAAALLLAEGLVRLLGVAPGINRINPKMKKTVFRFSDNPVLGYVHKENYRDEDNPDLHASFPMINSHGFRDRERQVEKEKGVKRIILLGDSVVAGSANIREIDDLISRKLEGMMEAEKVEVLGMGISGYNTRAEVELLKDYGLKFDPDLVILLFTNNDYSDTSYAYDDVTPSPVVAALFVHSHLFRYLGVAFDLFDLGKLTRVQRPAPQPTSPLEDAAGGDGGGLPDSEGPGATPPGWRRIASGASNVHEALPILKALAEEGGFRVAIGFWPSFLPEGIANLESFDGPELRPVFAPEKLTIERLAEEEGIAFFKLAGYFAEDYREHEATSEAAGSLPAPIDYYTGGDSMHPNPAGSEIAARALRDVLLKNPWLLERPAAGAN